MANVRVSTSAANAMLTALRDLIDAGIWGGKLNIYDGAQPASADAAVTDQTLLASLTFSDPCAPNASGRVLEFSAITNSGPAAESGEATWARITDSGGAVVFDCDVGVGGATINLNTTDIVAGGTVFITSGILTQL